MVPDEVALGRQLAPVGASVIETQVCVGRCVVPFGLDTLVVVLSASYGDIFWIFPLLATGASLAGAALAYWMGRTAGCERLPRLMPARHLERVKRHVSGAGAGALGSAAVMPPPFPLTAFVMMCGALDIDRRRFFAMFGVMRLMRFGTESLLARHYGEGLLQIVDTDGVRTAVAATAMLTVMALSVILWRRTRPQLA
jgi:membrane protein YqaA with SNARE-associated domain